MSYEDEWRIKLPFQFTYFLRSPESFINESLTSGVYQNVAAVLDYCMDACAKQRDRVNITLPSVGAVQMLSQK